MKTSRLKVVTVSDLGGTTPEYQIDKCPFKAILKYVSWYPTIYVESLVTGREYEVYPYSVQEFDCNSRSMLRQHQLHYMIKDKDITLEEKVYDINTLYGCKLLNKKGQDKL